MRARTASMVVMASMVVIAAALLLQLTACAGEVDVPDGRPPATDGSGTTDTATADSTPVADGAPCNEGDKRCDGLERVAICEKGQWTTLLDCSGKTIQGNACYCSMTMMYVCAWGSQVCP